MEFGERIEAHMAGEFQAALQGVRMEFGERIEAHMAGEFQAALQGVRVEFGEKLRESQVISEQQFELLPNKLVALREHFDRQLDEAILELGASQQGMAQQAGITKHQLAGMDDELVRLKEECSKATQQCSKVQQEYRTVAEQLSEEVRREAAAEVGALESRLMRSDGRINQVEQRFADEIAHFKLELSTATEELQRHLVTLRSSLPQQMEALEQHTQRQIDLLPPKLLALRDFAEEGFEAQRKEGAERHSTLLQLLEGFEANLKRLETEVEHRGHSMQQEVRRLEQELDQRGRNILHEVEGITEERNQMLSKLVLVRHEQLESQLNVAREQAVQEVEVTRRDCLDRTTQEVQQLAKEWMPKIVALREHTDVQAAEMKAGEMRRHEALGKLFEANMEILNEKVISVARQAEHAIDKVADDNQQSMREMMKYNSDNLERKLSHFRSTVEEEVGEITHKTVKKVSELKQDEQRHTRELSQLLDARHEALQSHLHEFKKDAMAEVDTIRQGVNTIDSLYYLHTLHHFESEVRFSVQGQQQVCYPPQL